MKNEDMSNYDIELKVNTAENVFQKENMIKIVKRLIELKIEYWNKAKKNDDYYGALGKSDGIDKALVVIDGFLNFDSDIHKLIDDSYNK